MPTDRLRDMARFTLATLQTPEGPKAAIGVADSYHVLSDLSEDFRNLTVKLILEDWAMSLPRLEDAASRIDSSSRAIAAKEATLLTPILWPNKLVCVGANYAEHLKEMGMQPTKWEPMPFFLCPPSTTMVGPGETVRIPKMTRMFDWELELAVIVGKRLQDASIEEASRAIAGYSIGLDLSCRDLIRVDNEMRIDLVRGKAQDTMKPLGPFVVPAKFVSDVRKLKLTLDVNGERMMDSCTDDMLFNCEEMISIVSRFVTLEPGDVVLTGSPSGSAGAHGNRWLEPGDAVHAEIEDIGALDVQMMRV